MDVSALFFLIQKVPNRTSINYKVLKEALLAEFFSDIPREDIRMVAFTMFSHGNESQRSFLETLRSEGWDILRKGMNSSWVLGQGHSSEEVAKQLIPPAITYEIGANRYNRVVVVSNSVSVASALSQASSFRNRNAEKGDPNFLVWDEISLGGGISIAADTDDNFEVIDLSSLDGGVFDNPPYPERNPLRWAFDKGN
jgi:hypothetical protein